MFRISFKDHRQAPIWLVGERFRMGRDPQNNLVLVDPSLSPFHTELRLENDHWLIFDVGSKTGTFVNGEQVTGRFQLRSGDNIRLGAVELTLEDSDKASRKKMPSVQKSEWMLQAISGSMAGQIFPINGTMTIGRLESCDIHFQDAHVSRRHSELSLKNNVLRIRDLGSSNGTFINKKPVKDAVLKLGDRINFDSAIFLVIGPRDVHVDDDDDDSTVFKVAATPPAVKTQFPSKPRLEEVPEEDKTEPDIASSAVGETLHAMPPVKQRFMFGPLVGLIAILLTGVLVYISMVSGLL